MTQLKLVTSPACVCGHEKAAHRHFNDARYCGHSGCGCLKYRENKMAQGETIMTMKTESTTGSKATVERSYGGMRKWMFLTPYHSDVNGKRFLTRFVFFFTPFAGAHITRIHMADDQRKWPHDHSASFLSIRLLGWYDENVYTDPGDLTKKQFRVHKWLSASRLRYDEAHSITAVAPYTVTLLLLGRRRNKSSYWTDEGKQPLGMAMDKDDPRKGDADEW
jgi:hypothetical protein